MQLAPTTYAILFYGSLVGAGIALLAAIAGREARVRRRNAPLPIAALKSGRARARAIFARWCAPVVLLGAGTLAYQLHAHARDLWLVSDGPQGPVVEKLVYLGDVDAAYPLAPGSSRPGDYALYDTWVVNTATREVRIELLTYGPLAIGTADPERVPPGTAMLVFEIDNIGPEHPPPRQVMATGIEAQLGQTSRAWLTWDR